MHLNSSFELKLVNDQLNEHLNDQLKDQLEIQFHRASDSILPWSEEVLRSSQIVSTRLPNELWVCSSGGIDSEIVCTALLKNNIKFKVLSLAHTKGTNSRDIAYAKRWCNLNQVEHRIEDFSPDDFFTIYIPQKIQEGLILPCPFRYFQIHLMERVEALGGSAILGGGEQLYQLNPLSQKVELEFDVGHLRVLSFAGQRHLPFFFFSTPELFLAYMKWPVVQFALHSQNFFNHKQNSYLLKRLVYQQNFPDLESREKLDGWEAVAIAFAISRSRLQKLNTCKVLYVETTEIFNQLTSQSPSKTGR